MFFETFCDAFHYFSCIFKLHIYLMVMSILFVLFLLQHEACNHGFVRIAELLLDNGAMINVPGMDNDTPLHDAVMNMRIDVVRMLVRRGANANAR